MRVQNVKFFALRDRFLLGDPDEPVLDEDDPRILVTLKYFR